MYPLAGRRSAWRCVTASSPSSGSSGGGPRSSASRSSASSRRSITTTTSASGSGRVSAAPPQALVGASASCRVSVLRHGFTLLLRPHRHNDKELFRLQQQQRRVLQTSSTSSSPSPPSSSSSPSPSSYSPPVESRSLFPRILLGRNRRLRYTRLPAIVMGAAQQTRDHGGGHGSHSHSHGHSHGLGHHHHHDNTYLVSKNRNDPGVRITNIGLASNLTMAVVKFVGGWAFNSKAMIADGWHSLTDLASDILTLATVSWSLKPPSDRFPLGFGKVESLGALGVSGMLLVGGCYMGWESALSLYGHFDPEAAHALLEHIGHGHGHSHSHSAASLGIPNIHAAWLAAGTIAVKEWLYQATMKVARERHSSVLASNAIHHRIDSLTGIVTLGAIVGANVIENAGWLDPVGGLLISIMVIHAGAGNMVDALCELADQSIDSDVKLSVQKQARRAIDTFDARHEVELRDVSGIKSGQNYMMDLEMAVPGTWSIEHVREMEEAVRQRVGAKVRGVRRVRVRFVSQDEPVTHKFDEFISRPDTDDPEPKEDEDSDVEEHKHDEKHRH